MYDFLSLFTFDEDAHGEFGCAAFKILRLDRLAAYEDTGLEPEEIPTALEMAKIKVLQLEYGQPIVNTYSFNENLLKDGTLRVKRYYDYTKDWAEFIVANRKNNTNMPIHDYDVVIGPIADDRIGVQLWQYESKMIDLETLMNRLKYIKGITIQYYFGTDKSIKYLERV